MSHTTVGNPFVDYKTGYAVAMFIIITIPVPVWALKLAMDADGTIKAYETDIDPDMDQPNGVFINPEPNKKVETIALITNDVLLANFGEWQTTITDIVFNQN